MICILFTLLIESLKWICELIWVSLCLLRSPCGLPPPVDEPREQDCINEAMKKVPGFTNHATQEK